MAKINFRKFKLYRDIAHQVVDVIDVTRLFADILYQNGIGIVIHDLALRIFHSEGEMELKEEEVKIIEDVARHVCTPAFIDSLKSNISE